MDIPVVPRPQTSAFWDHLERILPVEGDALDLGTGTGRVALHVAPHVRRVLGIDIHASSLDAARWDAKRRGLENATFLEADAETTDLVALNEGRPFALITSRLFLSLNVTRRACEALAPAGHLVIEVLESRHWVEAGGSKFNLGASDVIAAINEAGAEVRDARIERGRQAFANAREAEAHVKERRLWTKWRADGRWERLRAAVRQGDGGLTESHLVLWAQRPSG